MNLSNGEAILDNLPEKIQVPQNDIKQTPKEIIKKESKWVGKPGDMHSDLMVFNKRIHYESRFGPGTIFMFTDNNGNKFKWFTSSFVSLINEGNEYVVSGVIKDHDEYKDVKSTILKNVKVKETEHKKKVEKSFGIIMCKSHIRSHVRTSKSGKVSQVKEHDDKRKVDDSAIFHEDYKGPRWTYGLKYRPAGIGHQPKGFIIGSQGKHPEYKNFGTIDYARKLTEEEIYQYELGPIEKPNFDPKEVGQFKKRLSSYAGDPSRITPEQVDEILQSAYSEMRDRPMLDRFMDWMSTQVKPEVVSEMSSGYGWKPKNWIRPQS